MTIRQCPDCKGRGNFWRHSCERITYEVWSSPEVSSTAFGYKRVELPEYRECELCNGIGEVECSPAEKMVAKGE